MSMMNLSLSAVKTLLLKLSVSSWEEPHLGQRDWSCEPMDMRQNFIKSLYVKGTHKSECLHCSYGENTS